MLFYYLRDGRQIGPLSLKELSQNEIRPETLVWHEGLDNWKQARDISELDAYIKRLPPPIPTSLKTQTEKYDRSYKQETNATITGFIFLFVPLIIKSTNIIQFETGEEYEKAYIIIGIISLIQRFAFVAWVTTIAKKQNRDQVSWGVSAFFLPTLVLIVISFLKRIQLQGEPTYEELIKSNNGNFTSKNQEIFFQVCSGVLAVAIILAIIYLSE